MIESINAILVCITIVVIDFECEKLPNVPKMWNTIIVVAGDCWILLILCWGVELASGCVRLGCEFTDLLGQTGSDMCEFCKDVCGSDSVRTGFRRFSDFWRVIRAKQIVCYNTNQNIKVWSFTC